MLILIDDLDRCRPEKAREVLEAVNFLVSSGECFVMLGVERDLVEHYVGLSFRQVVDTMPGHVLDVAAGAGESEKRQAFARRYMNKLIQIEVAVPVPTPLQARKLFTGEEEQVRDEAEQAERRASRAVALTRGLAPRLAGLALVAVLFAGAYRGGVALAPGVAALIDQVRTAASETKTAAPLNPAGSPPTVVPGSVAPGAAAPKPSAPAKVTPAARLRTGLTWPFIVLIGLWRFLYAWLSSQPDRVVKDSPQFLEALEIWSPVVMCRQNTPRAAKRFLNSVRYLAMRQRAQQGRRLPVWERWVRRLVGAPEAPLRLAEPPALIPDTALVALAALHELDPGLVLVRVEWAFLRTISRDELAAFGLSEFQGQAFHKAVDEHEQAFQSAGSLAAHRLAFLALSAGAGYTSASSA